MHVYLVVTCISLSVIAKDSTSGMSVLIYLSPEALGPLLFMQSKCWLHDTCKLLYNCCRQIEFLTACIVAGLLFT